MQEAPCGARGITRDCPWTLWTRRQDRRKPGGIYGHGYNKGRRHFICECGRTFFRPAADAMIRPSFHDYMRWEATIAVADLGEAGTTVAARLGINRKTVRRWMEDPQVRSTVSLLNVMFPTDVVHVGRWYRRSETAVNDIYAIGEHDRDEFRYERASFGEIRYWLERERLAVPQDVQAWESVLFDSSSPRALRQQVIHEARQLLLEARPHLAELWQP